MTINNNFALHNKGCEDKIMFHHGAVRVLRTYAPRISCNIKTCDPCRDQDALGKRKLCCAPLSTLKKSTHLPVSSKQQAVSFICER